MAGTTIARLNTLVTANAAQFQNELGRAGDASKVFKSTVNRAMAAVGVSFGAAQVVAYGKSIIDLGGEITDLASQANMVPRTFQVISAYAAESGVTMQEVAKASENLRSKLQDAATDGANPLNKALKDLGLTAVGLQALKQEEIWETVARAQKGATDQQAAMNAVSELFGAKIGPKLRQTLDALSQGFDTAAQNARGLYFDDAQLKQLDEFGDKLTRLSMRAKIATVSLLDSSKGFQDFWRAITGPEKLVKGDIRIPGANMLKGGMAEQWAATGGAPGQVKPLSVADRMRMAEQAARDADIFAGIKEENRKKKEIEDALSLFFDPIDEAMKANQQGRKKGAGDISSRGIDFENTDALSRIGLLTGQVANPELKKQTDLLGQMNRFLDSINSQIGNMQAPAAFSN